MTKKLFSIAAAVLLCAAAAAGCAETASPTPALKMETNLAVPSPTPQLMMETNIAPQPTLLPNVTVMAFHEMRLSSQGFNVGIRNPEENEGLFYVAYTMSLKDTGEVLFETDLLAPGEVCESLTFSRLLPPGEYETVVLIQPYHMSNKSPTNNAMLEVKLIVEE